jgi:hypothetical protein
MEVVVVPPGPPHRSLGALAGLLPWRSPLLGPEYADSPLYADPDEHFVEGKATYTGMDTLFAYGGERCKDGGRRWRDTLGRVRSGFFCTVRPEEREMPLRELVRIWQHPRTVCVSLLDRRPLSDDDVASLCRCIAGGESPGDIPALRSISLMSSPLMSSQAVLQLSRAVCNPKANLYELSLMHCDLDADDVEVLVAAAISSTIVHLDLSENAHVGDRGAARIADVVMATATSQFAKLGSPVESGRILSELWLCGCGITAVGATSLALALAGPSPLRHLSLGENPLGDDGVRVLAQVLGHQNRMLVELCLRSTDVTSAVIPALCEMFSLNHGVYVDLTVNAGLCRDDRQPLHRVLANPRRVALGDDDMGMAGLMEDKDLRDLEDDTDENEEDTEAEGDDDDVDDDKDGNDSMTA